MINLGIDLDNTIIDYSLSLNELAITEYGVLINDSNATKNVVKNLITTKYGEKEWTRAQGLLYSQYIEFATPFVGFLDNIEKLQNIFNKIFIISHKTKFPISGPRKNLINLSRNWINRNIISISGKPFFTDQMLFFESSQSKKISRIAKQNCNVFIDDLPEVVMNLPYEIEGLLFEPSFQSENSMNFSNWNYLASYLIDKYA
jgi:hypothetical protein